MTFVFLLSKKRYVSRPLRDTKFVVFSLVFVWLTWLIVCFANVDENALIRTSPTGRRMSLLPFSVGKIRRLRVVCARIALSSSILLLCTVAVRTYAMTRREPKIYIGCQPDDRTIRGPVYRGIIRYDVFFFLFIHTSFFLSDYHVLHHYITRVSTIQ